MKITLFTSNNYRHNYLINTLLTVCDELFVIQECKNNFQEKNNEKFKVPKIYQKYSNKVSEAQDKVFQKELINNDSKKIKIFQIAHGELNKLIPSYLKDFLKSDLYVVFGSSYIKGELVDFLVKKKAINIHAGVSPYYRGSGCNFWALYDSNPHLVGSTIHLLSKGLDNGPILYHAMSKNKSNPFEYTMSTLKSAFQSLAIKIKDKSFFDMKPFSQDKSKEIRYTRRSDFNEKIILEYFKKKINLNCKKFNNSLLKDPFYLN